MKALLKEKKCHKHHEQIEGILIDGAPASEEGEHDGQDGGSHQNVGTRPHLVGLQFEDVVLDGPFGADVDGQRQDDDAKHLSVKMDQL